MGKHSRRNGDGQQQRRMPPEGATQRTQMHPDQRQDDELPLDADTDTDEIPRASQRDKQRNQPR